MSKQMKEVPENIRKDMGKFLNMVKDELVELFEEKGQTFTRTEKESTFFDYTLPGTAKKRGTIHPINQYLEKVLAIFTSMGYEVVHGNEVETEEYNFELLNIPKDHPARDIQDTFYIDKHPNWVMRTHTSNMQLRTMQERKPPQRIVSPGRVYRNEALDASHEAAFYQIEGFAIDVGIRLTDLLGTLETMMKGLFGNEVDVRFRPHYFPYTEPSLEVDMSCLICKQKGCSVCKKTGWIELLGAGLIHPKVIENMGIDSAKYSGFAFGVGIDRLMMLEHGINDVRLSYKSDLRFLKQF
jgi:phenylalanyl-tRNA synthetase alpha chain